MENADLKKRPKKPIKQRETWKGKLDFLFSTSAYAVGLSNLWRFPYLCYKYGGGSFMLAYTIMLIFVGFPMYFLELVLGQYSSVGSAIIFKRLCPIFSGVGYALWFSSILGNIAYSVVIAWTLLYLGSSFTDKLQWSNCDHEFNTNYCVDEVLFKECKRQNGSVFVNKTCYNATTAFLTNITDIRDNMRVSPEEEYLDIFVLNKTDGIDETGGLQWKLVICIVVTWIVVALCCVKGIKSSGKVVYITAAFSYSVLIILLIRGLTLDGAMDGIKHLLTPKWEELQDSGIWQEAAVQVFYSITIACGGLITMASYNKFNHNIVRDAIIVPVVDFIVNIIAGLSVFSVLGFMAKILGKDINDVASKGSGLAFITYAQALSRMPISPLWAVLFFLMLASFGLDSMFGGVTNVITGITDEYPRLRQKRALLTIIVCLGSLLLTIPLVTGVGIYFVELIFSFLGWPKIIIALIEVVIVGYIYGINNFMDDIKEMIDWNPNSWISSHFKVVLMTITPGLLLMIFILQFSDYEPYKSGDYYYPAWGNAIGWIIGMFPFVLILIAMIYKIFVQHRKIAFMKRMTIVLSPTSKWRKASVEFQSLNQPTEDNLLPTSSPSPLTPGIINSLNNPDRSRKSRTLSLTSTSMKHLHDYVQRKASHSKLFRTLSTSQSTDRLEDMIEDKN
ncbi:Sodium- and chloride-dependent glycine transporter 2 [Nymphon striatum]|nr:Sodium- and chloride-dependent glycine transporter 2 [Nymphon striatum]